LSAGIGESGHGSTGGYWSGWFAWRRVAVGTVQYDVSELLGPYTRHTKGVLIGFRPNIQTHPKRTLVFAAGVARTGGHNDAGPPASCFIFCWNVAEVVSDEVAPVVAYEATRDWWITGFSTSIIVVGGHARHLAIAGGIRIGTIHYGDPN
jgi:hypothetical protein